MASRQNPIATLRRHCDGRAGVEFKPYLGYTPEHRLASGEVSLCSASNDKLPAHKLHMSVLSLRPPAFSYARACRLSFHA